MDLTRGRRAAAGLAAAYVAGYVLLDWVSYIYPVAPYAITPWNPPPGLSLAMLLARSLRYAPLLFVASVLAEIAVRGTGSSPLEVLAYAAILAGGYTAIAAWLLRAARFDPRFATLRDLSVFTATIAIGAAAIAMPYIAAHVIVGRFSWSEWPEYTLRFWVGDVIGIIVMTPLLLVHAASPRRPSGQRVAETLLQTAVILAALLIVFRAGDAAAARYFYLLFLPLIWISVRRGFEGATAALFAMQIGLIAAVQLAGYESASVLELQLLMLTLSVTGLFLGMAVSEWRRVRRELERREAELKTVVSTAPDGILTVDDAGRIAAANGAAAAMFGTKPADLVGVPLSRHVTDLAPGRAPSRGVEARAVRRDGTVFPAEVSVGSAALDGRTLHVAIIRDMSQRKAIEEQLRDRDRELNRAMRVAAAAEMASALAHELNQPLTAASGYVQACDLMLQRTGGSDRRLFDAMEKAVAEVKRAAEVVRRLRDFYRGGTIRTEAVVVGELCRNALQALHNRLERHGVSVALDIPSDLPPVKVDRVQMEMVLHNLFANAIESMKAASDRTRHIEVAARAGPERFVQLSVHDTGPGLSPGVAGTLFQAFATSKAGGMGMGLAISRSIVEQHGGRLWLEDARPGATFVLTLPIGEERGR